MGHLSDEIAVLKNYFKSKRVSQEASEELERPRGTQAQAVKTITDPLEE
jgi:hypothetical protein